MKDAATFSAKGGSNGTRRGFNRKELTPTWRNFRLTGDVRQTFNRQVMAEKVAEMIKAGI